MLKSSGLGLQSAICNSSDVWTKCFYNILVPTSCEQQNMVMITIGIIQPDTTIKIE